MSERSKSCTWVVGNIRRKENPNRWLGLGSTKEAVAAVGNIHCKENTIR